MGNRHHGPAKPWSSRPAACPAVTVCCASSTWRSPSRIRGPRRGHRRILPSAAARRMATG